MNRGDVIGQLARRQPPAPAAAVIPTGSPAADLLLGGGWPGRGVSVLCGPPDSGVLALAVRAIAAAQLADPVRPAVLVARDYPHRDAARYQVSPQRLLLARDGAAAAEMAGNASLIVDVSYILQGSFPARTDTGTAVLLVAGSPRGIRAAACIRLHPRRGWDIAEPVFRTRPAAAGQAAVCGGEAAVTQEILDIAVQRGIVTVRGRWLAYGDRKIAGSWKDAVMLLREAPDLRMSLLQEITGQAPDSHGSAGIYHQLA